MMTLPIYGRDENGKRAIVKTYKAETYDLMWGTVEDVANAFKLDNVQELTEEQLNQLIGAFIVEHLPQVHEFLKDIFEDITDDEIRNTKAEDVVMVFIDLIIYTVTKVSRSFSWGKSSKNVQAGKRAR